MSEIKSFRDGGSPASYKGSSAGNAESHDDDSGESGHYTEVGDLDSYNYEGDNARYTDGENAGHNEEGNF